MTVFLTMNKVLVTGATGRVGANLVKRLLADGYSVRSYVMPNDPKAAKLSQFKVDVTVGDLTDPEPMIEAVSDVDAIVHSAAAMAGRIMPPGMTRSSFFDINVKGTYNLLEAAKDRAERIERFLFTSTDDTYPVIEAAYVPVDENHPQNPQGLYGCTKLLCEKLCTHYRTGFGLPTTIVRLGSVKACDEILNTLKLGNWIKWLRGWEVFKGVKQPWEPLENLKANPNDYVIMTDPIGKPWRMHSTDVRDVVDGIMLALTSKAAEGDVFNIMGPSAYGFDEAVTYASKRTGIPYVTGRVQMHWNYEIDISKARTVLGFAPRYDIHRMIDDALAYGEGKDLGVIPA